MRFDVRTTMLLTAVITLMLSVCLQLTLRRQEAPVGPAVVLWVRASALQPLAWLLMSLRDVIPDGYSVLVGNVLICFAYAEYPRALRLFIRGRNSSCLPYVLAALSVVPTMLFTWVWPSVQARTTCGSLIVACLFTLAAAAVVRGAPHPLPSSYAITACSFLAGVVLFCVRAVFETFNPLPLTSGLADTPMQALVFGYTALAPVIATFGFVLMCNDRSRSELERLAATDPLTGVLNRRMLEQLVSGQLADARRHMRPLSALLIDADHFKDINDGHGHDAGDAALKAMVAALRLQLRPGDLIGRLGGEEFLVVLCATDTEESLQVAERLRAAIAALDLRENGIRLPLSISIGVATLSDRSSDFGELVRRADRAMYAAKRAGRNRVEFAGPGPVNAPIQGAA